MFVRAIVMVTGSIGSVAVREALGAGVKAVASKGPIATQFEVRILS